ncbi:unnamed protein product [Mytilus coruscus]|uniref:IgGFc-binding protein N-terminal domain-containing protein n=1 Tax=Mytilus coruscus TaxID=42192 RepID=A0A6J8B5P2_MYTCO|nr:unnamed protein product [Mytilus coruscus]
MDAYADNVLHNNSVIMQKTIERKLNRSLSRRLRRFRNIMHSDIRSTLQHVKNEIDAVLSENFNKSDFKNTDGTRIGKLTEKTKGLFTHLKDHKGKLFYTMFPIQQVEWQMLKVQFIFTADKTTNVEIISEYAGINSTLVITTGVAYINIPNLVINLETGRTYTTILISADQPITVVVFFSQVYCSNECKSSSFIILPFIVLGTEYSLITLPNNNQNCGIITTATNTTVVIESASERNITVGSSTIHPGQTFNIIVLDYLEGFLIQTNNNLTAWKIFANKPIAVISGNKYTFFKESYTYFPYCYKYHCYTDIVYESLIPVDKWVRHYVIPLLHKASKNTTITITDNAAWSTTKQEDRIEVTLSPKSYFVSSSQPILLSLYAFTDNKGIAMMIVPGIEHFSRQYVIAPPKDPIHTSYISIMIKSSDVDGLRFIGNLLSVESTVIMARNESFSIVVKKLAGHSVYKIRHVSRNALYGVIVYGFGDSTAYAYPAGFRF